jgi:hypothetical protein
MAVIVFERGIKVELTPYAKFLDFATTEASENGRLSIEEILFSMTVRILHGEGQKI